MDRFDPTAVARDTWLLLGRALREGGLDAEVVLASERLLPSRHDALRMPLVLRGLERDPRGAALLARLFVYDAVVELERAERLLGARLVATLLEQGALRRAGGGLESRIRITPFHDVLVASDPVWERQPVIPPGPTTLELLAVVPERLDGARVLDLGCGPGSLAAVLARRGATLVATDVDPRACAFAAATSALNEQALDVRAVDGVVAGERAFDLVVCQPPFVPEPEGSERTTYLHGGARGDELGWRLFREAKEVTRPGGTLAFRLDLPGRPDDARASLERLVPTSSFVAFVAPGPNTSELAMAYALASARTIDEGAALRARAYADAFERQGITHVSHALVVGFESPDRARDVHVVPSLSQLTSEEVTVAREAGLVARLPDDALAKERLVLPANAVLARRARLSSGEERISVEAPSLTPVEISPPVALLLDVIAQGATLEEAAEALARSTDASPEQARAASLGFARDALRTGLLRPDTA